MRREDAYSAGHLALSHYGLAFVLILKQISTELFLISRLLRFKHPSVLLSYFRFDGSPTLQVLKMDFLFTRQSTTPFRQIKFRLNPMPKDNLFGDRARCMGDLVIL